MNNKFFSELTRVLTQQGIETAELEYGLLRALSKSGALFRNGP